MLSESRLNSKINNTLIKGIFTICLSIVMMFLLNLKASASSRVIYDINQISLTSYKVDIKWNNENLGNLQITGLTKKDDDTILVSYKKYSKLELTSITLDVNDLNMNLSLNKPNVILVDENGNIDKLKDNSNNVEIDNAIANLYLRGVINGYEDGTFKPNSLITKEEFCSMFFNMMKYKLDTETNSKFYDLPNERWSKNIIMSLNKLGIITGQDDGNFGTLKNVTLGEVSTIIKRAKNMSLLPNDKIFIHEKNFHWANVYISILISNGIINEKDTFYYESSQDLNLTRGQVALILNRV